ncbi:hypothetical protein BDZ94DRAFT_1305076 [Collybia nuda]|uniref:Ubiquitin 3 binding protein But2 C-terminal domain-containing protein n=1 Tax=Collybia nuda TaxID=64659 RepID=A0A9P5YHV5_9AGAR|nr:hypothetical protein BDZ94DRAFT_1305076 [Collybia nuda]
MSSSGHYTALSHSSDDLVDDDNKKQYTLSYTIDNPYPRLFFWACIVSILSSLVSLVLLIPGSGNRYNINNVPRVPPNKPMRRPNQYMGLDKVFAGRNHTEPFPPLVGFPSVLMQIKRSDPKREMREDERGHRSPVGFIYPDDRHFIVSSETSTIAQFRHLDYGMERCQLVIKIPKPTDILDPAIQLPGPSVIDIWTLDSPDELSPYTIWDYAPIRKSLFVSLNISEAGEATSPRFLCPSGLFSTFEFVCSGAQSCLVDFWQNKEAPHGGVHMVQYDSLIGEGL